jgi:hypothetical protein
VGLPPRQAHGQDLQSSPVGAMCMSLLLLLDGTRAKLKYSGYMTKFLLTPDVPQDIRELPWILGLPQLDIS